MDGLIGKTKTYNVEFIIEDGVPNDAVEAYLEQQFERVVMPQLREELTKDRCKRISFCIEMTDLEPVVPIRELKEDPVRQRPLTLQVKVDREYGYNDIGRKVKFNPKTRLFENADEIEPGYTVIAYESPCLATVDFTLINSDLPPERQIKTVEDLYDFFDAIEEARKQAREEVRPHVVVELTDD